MNEVKEVSIVHTALAVDDKIYILQSRPITTLR